MTIRSQVQYFIFTFEFKKPAFRPVTASETKLFSIEIKGFVLILTALLLL